MIINSINKVINKIYNLSIYNISKYLIIIKIFKMNYEKKYRMIL